MKLVAWKKMNNGGVNDSGGERTMTTPAAARLYLAQHELQWEGKPFAVFNPHDKPVNELPVIYGFNNGGKPSTFLQAVALAEDGTCLGGHGCSAEGYMPADLGMLKGARPDRHEGEFQPHYPNGYRCEFVPSGNIEGHAGLQAAIEKAKANVESERTEKANEE
jgi:hypothetical protein